MRRHDEFVLLDIEADQVVRAWSRIYWVVDTPTTGTDCSFIYPMPRLGSGEVKDTNNAGMQLSTLPSAPITSQLPLLISVVWLFRMNLDIIEA